MVTILMMLAKMVTLGLLKRKILWNKGYDVIVYAHDVTNKISMWSCDQSLVTLTFLQQKLS